MRSPLDALQTPPPVDLRPLARRLHGFAKQASFYVASGGAFFDFWLILGQLWEAKTNRKSIFWRAWGDAFFDCVLAWILYGFLKARVRKNSNFPEEKQ